MQLLVYKSTNKLFDLQIPSDELLEGMEFFIGRADECHIVIEDQLISRHHAVIIVEKDKIALKKLTQFGDILINGISLDHKTDLRQSDKIAISNYIIEVVSLDQVSASPLMLNEFIDENKTEILPIEQDQFIEDSTKEIESNDEQLDQADPSFDDDTESFDSSSEEELSSDDEFSADNNSLDSSEDNFEESEGFNQSEDGFSEDGFSDEGFADDGYGEDSGGEKTQVFQSFASYSLKIFGELAPFDNFKIEETEIFIGRDPEKCQIVLDDPEVSSVHAKIHKSMINCVLEDLNSSNGTILNGNRINKAELVNGDEFLIGETSFTVLISSDLIEAEKDILMPVAANQEVEVIEEVEEEVDFDELGEDSEFSVEKEEEPKSIIVKIMKDPKKKRIVLYGLLGIFILYLMNLEDQPKVDTKKANVAKVNDKSKDKKENENKLAKKNLSPEVLEKLEQLYALALAKYEEGNYTDAKYSLDEIRAIDPNYKDTQSLLKLVKQGYEEIERLKKEEQAEKERQERNLFIKQLVEKARVAVEKREVEVSRNYFTQILEKDPENIDVPQMKMIIDAYVKEKEDKRLAEEELKAKRLKMVESLRPGKTLFLKEDWYSAIGHLEKFIKLQGIDEDLIQEATDMLKTSRRKLSSTVNPMLGKARSLKEGQDLKQAYELYGEVLKIDPSNEESLVERQDIKELLDLRSRKVYREALISESLSLFDEAKEKFQEVQQISPSGSEYYLKASKKLRDYLE